MKTLGIFLGTDPGGGGVFQYSQSILEASRDLKAKGFDVKVAFVSKRWGKILESYPYNAKRMVLGKWGLFLSNLFMAIRLPGLVARLFSSYFNPIPAQILRLRCDIWIFPAQDALSYQVNVPVLATIHDLMHRYEPYFPEVAKNNRWKIREHRFKSIVAWSRGILVDSAVGRNHVKDSYSVDEKKIYILPYVPPVYIRERDEPHDFDEHYSLPNKFIFYPAQFWSHKNHKRLVSAACKLCSEIPDIALVFTGGKEKGYEELRRHIYKLDMNERVTFVGHVPDKYFIGFYRRARAMIMPTFFGPTNIPPLEAFASGCPVGISNIYGMPDQVSDAALLFDPNSEEEIASAVRRLWQDDILCDTLTSNGYRMNKNWGPEQFAKRFTDILETLMF